MNEDGSVTLKGAKSLGIKGQYPRQAVIHEYNFVFYTDMEGDIRYVILPEYNGDEILLSDPKYLQNKGDNVRGS